MEALFSAPMPEILDRVEVSGEVRAALLEREGEYGAMLRVAEELEGRQSGGQHSRRALSAALAELGLSVKQVREIELAAFGWVHELSGAEVA